MIMKTKLLTVFIFFATVQLFPQSGGDENQHCFRCHSMESLGIKTSDSPVIQNFSLTPAEFNESFHAGFLCIDCHSEEFQGFPHPAKSEIENPFCTDCHDEDLEIKNYKLGEIISSLDNSVHREKLSCSGCHNPHTLKLRESLNNSVQKSVRVENQMCFECHNSDSSGKTNLLPVIHNTVDNQNGSWNDKKCVDCHGAKVDGTPNVHLINAVIGK